MLLITPEVQAVQLNVIGVMDVLLGVLRESTLAISSQSTFIENVVKAEVLDVLAQTVYSVKSRNSEGIP